MDISNDRQARFDRLYREHVSAVLVYALRRVRADQADDLVGETFLVAWRRFDDLIDGEPLPWLYAIARRVLSTQRRSNTRQSAIAERVAFTRPAEASPPHDQAATPVLHALATLEQSDREVLELAAFEQLSSKQAAIVLGCSANAYRIRLHRARKQLRLRLLELEPNTPTPHSIIPARAKEIPSW
jgi:RNA polymerase sigma-70 factor (ECF subfamily)